jgi:hypothetical protein
VVAGGDFVYGRIWFYMFSYGFYTFLYGGVEWGTAPQTKKQAAAINLEPIIKSPPIKLFKQSLSELTRRNQVET